MRKQASLCYLTKMSSAGNVVPMHVQSQRLPIQSGIVLIDSGLPSVPARHKCEVILNNAHLPVFPQLLAQSWLGPEKLVNDFNKIACEVTTCSQDKLPGCRLRLQS